MVGDLQSVKATWDGIWTQTDESVVVRVAAGPSQDCHDWDYSIVSFYYNIYKDEWDVQWTDELWPGDPPEAARRYYRTRGMLWE